MRYLLDTCVISELVSKKPETAVIDWIDGIDDEYFYLSVITIGEIKKGIEKLPDSERKELLASWLEEDLLSRFQGRILSFETAVMLTWGSLTAKLEQEGKKLPAIDSLIAAIALTNNLTLVTRNIADFQNTGVSLLNPWP
ncbi:MAG: type II toxin-antitoxin system VapC family toxin [Chloroflexi bacterium]|nr:type II toxin-antitoxin system VapC family toxin [Chloroflexota bacterium]MBP7593873.1 type II toxin-antitoxin system VapC family toxin [Chloroflexota bacterium]